MDKEFPFPFADMHCHILPAVDDGSKNEEMSLNMLRIAADNNIRLIIATPHNKIYLKSASPEGIIRRVIALQDIADANGIKIKILPGNELYYDSTLPERLEGKKALSLAASDSILVEFSPDEEYSYMAEGLRHLRYEGWHPVLAHCERYECLYRDSDRIQALVQEGIRLQVNAESVMAGRFTPVGRFVKKLLKDEMVSFVATDAHRDTGSRKPDLAECGAYIIRKCGVDYARKILLENALLLATGQRQNIIGQHTDMPSHS
jgi:protein-tyrosine phosphatase